MKIKYIENETEFYKTSHMAASSKEQNTCLQQACITGELDYHDILIMIDKDNNVVARVLLKDERMSFLTIEAISLEKAKVFIAHIQQITKTGLLSFHLYSDKCNHDILMQALLETDFKIIQEKESYIQVPYETDHTLIKKDGTSVTKEAFIDLFIQAAPFHKDRSFQNDYAQLGIKGASEEHYQEVVDDHDDPSFRIVAYEQETPIGFIIINKLMSDIAGIGYIGVIHKYRGKGFGKQLLEIASDLCAKYHFKQIQADIDTQNNEMRKHLLAVGYILSCDEKVFVWKH